MLICDLTQSWSASAGGGVSTYLREKQRYFVEHNPARLLRIVPGEDDRVEKIGEHLFATVRAPKVPGSPHYRFILRTKAVHALLREYMPDVIESHCPWILPWVAINHRRTFPQTALIAGYHTDFPNVHIHRGIKPVVGERVADKLRDKTYGHARRLYDEFDWLYVLNQETRDMFAGLGIDHTSILSFGVDTELFSPASRDPNLRRELGLKNNGPLLVYAGRLDNEKRAPEIASAFKRLPGELKASLILVGDGKSREPMLEELAGLDVAAPGFIRDRAMLARILASSDIYISAMADETFGISIIEAQSAGLPIAGVDGGAMPDRVIKGTGLLGPVGDSAAMAANLLKIVEAGPAIMGTKARAHVLGKFSWANTFNFLLEDIYPKAMRRRDQRLIAI